MENYFYALIDAACTGLTGDEVLLAYFEGEASHFVRFNQNKIRQAGRVNQYYLSLTLIHRQKQVKAKLALSGLQDEDTQRLKQSLAQLREQIGYLPDDPYLNYATTIRNTSNRHQADTPSPEQMVDDIIRTADGLDMVGIFSSGPVFRGFANSLGQRNWQEVDFFHFDWSCYLQADKAVKNEYAGMRWQSESLQSKMEQSRHYLSLLNTQPLTLKPGAYRTYLAPAAASELMDMMTWGGFGIKSHRTASSALLKLSRGESRFHERFSLTEDTQEGLSPVFTPEGFIRPERVHLIEHGRHGEFLINPRSAEEFQLQAICAQEAPDALSLAPGELHPDNALASLHDGLLINNLWYCNFTDRNRGQINGMTRYACFYVENGRIKAPINVMRFDDSFYSMFGENLESLSNQAELIIDGCSYQQRSLASYRLPGLLLGAFNLSF